MSLQYQRIFLGKYSQEPHATYRMFDDLREIAIFRADTLIAACKPLNNIASFKGRRSPFQALPIQLPVSAYVSHHFHEVA